MLTFPKPHGESRLTYEGDPELPKTIFLAVTLIGVFALGLTLVVTGLW